MAELETAYAPQKQAVQERMNQLPGFYEAQRGGVETARTNAYQDITRQANARGMAYSGAPIQEQQRYTGERYLPALAQLSGQEGEQRYGLQQALGQLGTQQLTYAQSIRQKEMELDEARRQFDAQLAAQKEAEARAARAAAAGGMNLGSLLGGGGGGQQQPAQGGGDPIAATVGSLSSNTNPYVWRDFLMAANQQKFGGKASYGQLANWLEQYVGKGQIGKNSGADVAFRNIFLGAPLEAPKGGPVAQQVTRYTNASPGNAFANWLGSVTKRNGSW